MIGKIHAVVDQTPKTTTINSTKKIMAEQRRSQTNVQQENRRSQSIKIKAQAHTSLKTISLNLFYIVFLVT
jgi:hypothetical protein